MTALQYTLGIVLGSAGLWLIVINWLIFWKMQIRKEHAPSWTPLLGGALLYTAITIWPENPLRWIAAFAFVLDWGSVPGLGHALWFHRIRR